MAYLRKTLLTLASTTVIVLAALSAPTATAQQSTFELPSIGSPADALLPRNEEARIGRQIMRWFHQQGRIIEHPEPTEYINDPGHRLAGHVVVFQHVLHRRQIGRASCRERV